MQWNMRMVAAQRGIWKSSELRRMLAEAGFTMSAGKMSNLWSGTPATVRLEELDIICAVLECAPSDVLITEPDKVTAARPKKTATASTRAASTAPAPRLGRNRSKPPA
jgi:putative transcriptional regulator